MKNTIAAALATALVACGQAGTGVHGNPVSVDYYGALPFSSLTGATIDVFQAADGTSQYGSTITVPTCTQPVASTATNCFDPGLGIGNFAGAAGAAVSTTVGAAVAAGTTLQVASSAGFVQYETVTVGAYTATAETTLVNSIVDATHITVAKAFTKAHAVGDPVVTSSRFAKFYNYSLSLPGSAAPGTNYWITIKYFNGGTQVGINSLQNVKVVSGKVNTLTLSASNTYTTANGVVITASSGFGTYQALSTTAPFSVTALDPSGGTLTYAWTATSCGSATIDTPAAASMNLTTTATAASACVVKVTVTSSNGVSPASKSTTINVANDAAVVVNAAPPQINQITITSPNPADTTCTLTRAAPGCVGNACWTAVSCPLAFNLSATPANPDNVFDPQSAFLGFNVQAALGGSGFNPSAPPAVSVSVFCANDTTDYGTTAPGKSFSFNPGYASSAAVNGNANDIATDGYVSEPTFSYGKGAWDETDAYAVGDLVVAYGNVYQAASASTGQDPADGAPYWTWVGSASAIPVAFRTGAGTWAANYAGTIGFCTATVKVTNQSGGADSVPVGLYFQ